uniref:Phosphoinositide phospholipase C n=1 Tax=Globodera pallida TaxID=36090 RepID=A0A183BZK0_GLOPA
MDSNQQKTPQSSKFAFQDDFSPKCSLPVAIEAIKEVRVGWNSELLRITEAGIAAEIQEECAFSIIHGDDYECLDLIALNAGDANVWVTGLMALASRAVPGPDGIAVGGEGAVSPVPSNLRERWLESAFRETDAEKRGSISEKAAVRLIRSLNPRLLTNRISKKVKEIGTTAQQNCSEAQQKGRVDEAQFVEVYKDLSTRPEIYFLMVRYANKDYLNTNDLQLFLETEQGLSGVSVDFCENLIDQCEPSAEARELNVMTVDGFTNYLLSQSNSAFDVAQMNVCQEMSRPFSHYFISTSFNTYLVEDQLKGPSSVDGYISAMKRNCRFIELDVWEEGGRLVVFNGGTLTTKLALPEVLDVVAELAFERTRYPLLIRLELHLHNVDAQRRLLALLEQKLGSRLYRPTMDPTDWRKEVPTPKRFLYKIILSGVRYEGQSLVGEVDEEDESVGLIDGLGKECPVAVSPRRVQLIRELRDLIAPFAVFGRAKDASDLQILSPSKHIVSISEGDCLHLVHSHPPSVYRNFLVRVTPNPQRVDSSNLNPQEFWNFGFSFVALNYQTPGLMMDLQEGKFLANGGCGYVLKPPIMCCDEGELISVKLNGDIADDRTPEGPQRKVPSQPQILHLKVLSAQQLPRPRASTAKGDTGTGPSDPFVVLEVFGMAADCAEERSKTVRNDSFNPSFDESFQFAISVPQLALVRFLVLDDDFIGDDFIGQYTIPFDCLQSGYRHIPLLNNEGDPLEGSTLFVHIAITNRRGGGKPKKRGLSVKRKMSRVQTGMKSVGIREMDDLFKTATGPLAKFIELKGALEAALNIWNEESGVGQSGSIRQGLVRLNGRIAKEIGQLGETAATGNCGDGTLAHLQQQRLPQQRLFAILRRDENHFALRVVTGQTVPDSLQKALNAFNSLLTHSSAICQHSDAMFATLSESSRRVADCAGDLTHTAAEAGLRGQKATRASENFAWNERLLKAQLGLMQSTFADARDILAQVAESARVLGLLETADAAGDGRKAEGTTIN